MEDTKVTVVSVSRDRDMYLKCVGDNPCYEGCRKVVYDNSLENVPISVRYNSFLETCSEDCWIVFCHEDWQVLEPLRELVSKLDPDCIYGPIGAYLQRRYKSDYVILKGSVREGTKDFKVAKMIKSRVSCGRVDTIDCQCLIVHSSLVRRFSLAFDEKLLFDMYAEDFCAAAFAGYGIITRVTPIRCIHYSPGNISEGFLASLEYVRAKYRGSAKRFATIVGYKTVFGGNETRPVHRTRFPMLSTFLGDLTKVTGL